MKSNFNNETCDFAKKKLNNLNEYLMQQSKNLKKRALVIFIFVLFSFLINVIFIDSNEVIITFLSVSGMQFVIMNFNRAKEIDEYIISESVGLNEFLGIEIENNDANEPD